MNNRQTASQQVADALQRMYDRQNAGIKYDLQTVRALLQRVGDPQETFAAIHVAGTNGKGSVCATIDAVLRAGGLTTGLYTSPHLLRFNERIQIDGRPIDDDTLAMLIERVETADRSTAAQPGGRTATFFEFTTVLAFLAFQSRNVRLAVVETGLGGRLDATNVLTPAVSVITRIGLDHAEWLGNTLAAVAAEKAGIIKPGRPVVVGMMPDAARHVIDKVAAERGSPLVSAADVVSLRPLRGSTRQAVVLQGALEDYGTIPFVMPVGYRLENLATSVATLETFSRITSIPLTPDAMRKGLFAIRWPAQLQTLCDHPPVVLDGAHNADGVAALLKVVTTCWKNRPIALVTGICADKDVHAMLRAFHRHVRRCWTVSFDSPRALPGEILAEAARHVGPWDVTTARLPEALDAAIEWAEAVNGLVLIAGSLFLAGDVLRLDRWRQAQGPMPSEGESSAISRESKGKGV